MQQLLAEYVRPWKLASLAAGLGLLLAGADYYHAPDWDYRVSFIMAFLTYLTAPWSVQVLRDRKWRRVPLALFWYYLAVDGSYWLYWQHADPAALDMREANFYASTCLYWLCGFVWLHNGPLKDLLHRGHGPVPAIPLPGIRQVTVRLATVILVFGTVYLVYSAATGRERMTRTCSQITTGMDLGELIAFAEIHDLGPRSNLTPRTRLAYLAESRSMGRHACRVELDGGKVTAATYNYAD